MIGGIKSKLIPEKRQALRSHYRTLSIVFILFLSGIGKAQTPQIAVSLKTLSVLSKYDNTFMVFDEPTYYWTKVATDKRWKKNNYEFSSSEISFDNFSTSLYSEN